VRGFPCRRGLLRRLQLAGGSLLVATLAAAALPSPVAAATTGDATWTTLPLTNGWVCDNDPVCGYRVDGLGFVHFEGGIHGGSSWTAVSTAIAAGARTDVNIYTGAMTTGGGNWQSVPALLYATAADGIVRVGAVPASSSVELSQLGYLATGQTGQDVDADGAAPASVVVSGFSGGGIAALASLQDSMLVIGAIASALLAFLVGRRVVRG
jgi:hypothetical protein